MEDNAPKKRGRKPKSENSNHSSKKKANTAVVKENMGFELLEWNGIGYWAIRSASNPNNFLKFEVNLMNRYYWFKLCPDNPFEPMYPDNDGWILEVWPWGGEEPVATLNDHRFLRKAKFEELFCCMTILAQDVSVCPNLFSIPESKTCELRKQWQDLMNDMPEWLGLDRKIH